MAISSGKPLQKAIYHKTPRNASLGSCWGIVNGNGIAPRSGSPVAESRLRPHYGLVSAPREWYLDVNDTMEKKCKLERLKTDPCVWVLRGPSSPGSLFEKETLLIIASHVDDFLICGQLNHPRVKLYRCSRVAIAGLLRKIHLLCEQRSEGRFQLLFGPFRVLPRIETD